MKGEILPGVGAGTENRGTVMIMVNPSVKIDRGGITIMDRGDSVHISFVSVASFQQFIQSLNEMKIERTESTKVDYVVCPTRAQGMGRK